MKTNLNTAIRFTLITTLLLGILYPLVMTGLAHWLSPMQANGSLIMKNGEVIGSHLIGQPFTSDKYFHSRPSAAGNGYDPLSSGGSNLAPTNHALVERVQKDVAALQQENPGVPIPVDLITTSASGLDPHISPAAAQFQIARISKVRGIDAQKLQQLVQKHTEPRQFGFLGEPRVNVLELNLDLDSSFPAR